MVQVQCIANSNNRVTSGSLLLNVEVLASGYIHDICNDMQEGLGYN